MTTYSFIVDVEADTFDQAQQVMNERIDVDEDYGFEYSVDWRPIDDDQEQR